MRFSVMDSREVIENIDSIYERFRIPWHLQMHMKRAAAIAKLICRNRQDDKINEDDVVAVMLLHDLGNVVRFNFDNEDLNSLYGEKSDIEELKKIREEAIEKYGEDDHEVTGKMCQELGISERVMFLMGSHAFIKNKEVCASDDFDLKVCAYADQRVGPLGVLGLKERLDDAIARSSTRPWYSGFEELKVFAKKIEEQLLENVGLSAEEINDDSIEEYLDFNHNNS